MYGSSAEVGAGLRNLSTEAGRLREGPGNFLPPSGDIPVDCRWPRSLCYIYTGVSVQT